jgi:hypothetical protein
VGTAARIDARAVSKVGWNLGKNCSKTHVEGRCFSPHGLEKLEPFTGPLG